jgi:hypothetical protein
VNSTLLKSTLLSLLFALSAGCNDPGKTTPSPEPRCATPPGQITSSGADKVRYVGAWDMTDVVPLDGGRLQLPGDVVIDSGIVTTFSVQLVSCEVFDDGCSPVAAVVREFGIKRAFAGHGSEDVEPTKTPSPVTETWSEAADVALGEGIMEGGPYCGLHLLVGRFPAVFGVSDPDSMAGFSVRVSGQRPAGEGGNESAVKFVAEGAMAHGEILPLPTGELVIGPAVVRLERKLGAALDRVQWQTMSSKDVARQIVQNLVTSTVVHIEAGD